MSMLETADVVAERHEADRLEPTGDDRAALTGTHLLGRHRDCLRARPAEAVHGDTGTVTGRPGRSATCRAMFAPVVPSVSEPP
jgi:hypothetical protein